MSGSIAGSPLLGGAGVDASIPLRGGQQQVNPLAQIGQTADIINSINRTKLFPGQLTLQGQEINKGALGLARLHNQAAAA